MKYNIKTMENGVNAYRFMFILKQKQNKNKNCQ